MADCVWCQNADINDTPPCEWVKENLSRNEADFTSPFPCAGTRAMYQSGNWGNNNNNATYHQTEGGGNNGAIVKP